MAETCRISLRRRADAARSVIAVSHMFRRATVLVAAVAMSGLPTLPVQAAPDVPTELASRLREVITDPGFEVQPIGPVRWSADGRACTVLEPSGFGTGRILARYDMVDGTLEVVATAAQLTPEGALAAPAVADFAVSRDESTVLLLADERIDRHGMQVGDYWFLDRASGALRKAVADVEQPNVETSFSPDGSHIVYSHGRNLHVQEIRTGAVTQLTTDGVTGDVGNGSSDWAWGYARWSPDGRFIAYLRSDVKGIGLFPLPGNSDATYPTPRYIRFPVPGTTIATQQLGVVPVTGGQTDWVDIPGELGSYYLEGLRWGRDANELVIQKLARSKDTRDLMLVDLRAGRVTTLLREEDPAWLDDVSTGYLFGGNPGFRWTRAGQAFTWLSEKSGWKHAYLISRDGGNRVPLTRGPADVISLVEVDEQDDWIYYIASPNDATQRYLYRARLSGGYPERITPADQSGTHEYQISPDAQWALHTYSTADTPPVTELISLPEHQSLRVLGDNAALRARLAAWKFMPTEFLALDIGDGVKLDAWMLKPRSFDPSGKYPVLVFVYGEAGVQTVVDGWAMGMGFNLLHRAFADAGYLVVSMDNRGTPVPKGAAWRRAGFGSLGILSTEDQAAGLRKLGRRVPYADLSRVGLWGHSAGGSSVLNGMFRKPDQFHVGIAIAPTPRRDLSNAWYQETFMSTPQENAEGYRLSSPINFAEGLKGDLLIIHGTGDENTHLQGVELLVNRLVELGKSFDYMPYPGRGHGIDEDPATRLHVALLMARHLQRHLPADPETRVQDTR